jgi:hypothetical protein
MKAIGDKRPPATAGLPFAKTEAVKKPNFHNHFENFSQLEALRLIIRFSLHIFFVQKMRENQANWFFHNFKNRKG